MRQTTAAEAEAAGEARYHAGQLGDLVERLRVEDSPVAVAAAGVLGSAIAAVERAVTMLGDDVQTTGPVAEVLGGVVAVTRGDVLVVDWDEIAEGGDHSDHAEYVLRALEGDMSERAQEIRSGIYRHRPELRPSEGGAPGDSAPAARPSAQSDGADEEQAEVVPPAAPFTLAEVLAYSADEGISPLMQRIMETTGMAEDAGREVYDFSAGFSTMVCDWPLVLARVARAAACWSAMSPEARDLAETISAYRAQPGIQVAFVAKLAQVPVAVAYAALWDLVTAGLLPGEAGPAPGRPYSSLYAKELD